MVEIPVARLYLSQQSALGMFAVSEQPARPDIVGQDGKQQGILAIVLEHHQTLHQVCPKQGIRLPFRHRRRKAFSLLQLMTVSDIGCVLEPVQSLEVLDAEHATLKRWQREQCIPSVLSGKP